MAEIAESGAGACRVGMGSGVNMERPFCRSHLAQMLWLYVVLR